MKTRPSIVKRQKEIARLERQQAKAERRSKRKQERDAHAPAAGPQPGTPETVVQPPSDEKVAGG
ncbi:MAG: hypothetical protein HY905_10805 [Deltaproteobacteria bacterium]|nr:hypothetical protein [Deltaproteobacteria bacterium]